MDTAVLVMVMGAVVVAFIRSIVWVQGDIRERTGAGNPVVANLGSLELRTPQQWTVALVIAWGIAFPVYMYKRAH